MLVRQSIAAATAATTSTAMQLSSLSRAARVTSLSASSLSSSSRATISSRPFASTPLSTSVSRQQLVKEQRSVFRRAYSDQAALPPPPQPKKKRFRFFRWTYRLTMLGLLGSAGYLGYSIYLLRHPEEQIEPDPSKKTLVILGQSFLPQFLEWGLFGKV